MWTQFLSFVIKSISYYYDNEVISHNRGHVFSVLTQKS